MSEHAKEYRNRYPATLPRRSAQWREAVNQMRPLYTSREIAEAWGFNLQPCVGLQQALDTAGMSQSQLATILGLTTSIVSQWATGKKNPDVVNARVLCSLFGPAVLRKAPTLKQFVWEKGLWLEFQAWCTALGGSCE